MEEQRDEGLMDGFPPVIDCQAALERPAEAIRVGDLVKYRIGRGFSVGRVLNVVEDEVTVEQKSGSKTTRRLHKLARVA